MTALLSLVHRTWRCFRSYGVTETFFRILHRLRIISAVHSLDIFLKDLTKASNSHLDGTVKSLKTMGYDLTCREVTLAELEKLEFAEGLQSTEWIEEQFREGSRLFAAFDGERIVAVNWVNTGFAALGHVKRIIRLSGGVAYLHGSLTAPDDRSKGIGSFLKYCSLCVMQQEGFNSSVSAVFLDNLGAQRWQERSGYHRWGRITYLRWRDRDFWRMNLTRIGRQYRNLLDHPARIPHAVQTLEEVA